MTVRVVVQDSCDPLAVWRRGVWLQVIDSGPIAKWVARALVCAYYVNQVGGWVGGTRKQ